MSAEVAYQHAEAPRSVAASRGTKSKYRPPPQQEQFGNSLVGPSNIMFDRRVVRGNTYAAQIIPPVRAAPVFGEGRVAAALAAARPVRAPLTHATRRTRDTRTGHASGDAGADGAGKAGEEE